MVAEHEQGGGIALVVCPEQVEEVADVEGSIGVLC
jgi:hypothetical protein